MRELLWMAEARRIEAWNHTSAMMAHTAEMNRDPKSKSEQWEPADFHPYSEKNLNPPVLMKVPITALKSIFKRELSIQKVG